MFLLNVSVDYWTALVLQSKEGQKAVLCLIAQHASQLSDRIIWQNQGTEFLLGHWQTSYFGQFAAIT